MTSPRSTRTRLAFMLCGAAALALAGCSGGGSEGAGKGKAGGGRGPSGPAQVGYVVIQPTQVPVTTELGGRVVAYESSVRPQVAGIVQKRLFAEGTIVQAGQTLYQIDARVYRAAADQASANLLAAQATAEAAKVRADRYKPLAEIEAVSKQDYTDAAATARQANAAVAQNRAALASAQVNLGFTRVPAPITGRIGRSLVTVGSLVTASQADPMTTIQRLNPIFVDIQQSSADLLAMRRMLAQNGVMPASATVRLKLEDGSDYGQTGTVQFSEVVVNQATGTVTLRAAFPNPQGVLLPGMFVRSTFAQAIDSRAFLVPQQALLRDPRGQASVYVVGPGNKAIQRNITAERAIGAFWVVTKGLNPGDKVITQGIANVKPNAEVKPVEASTPQRIEVPKKGQGQGAGGAADAGAAKKS